MNMRDRIASSLQTTKVSEDQILFLDLQLYELWRNKDFYWFSTVPNGPVRYSVWAIKHENPYGILINCVRPYMTRYECKSPFLTLWPSSCLIENFTHLKLSLAGAIHNFKLASIFQI